MLHLCRPSEPKVRREKGGIEERRIKPAFKKLPENQSAREGTMVRFDCIVTGKPRPDLYWFRDQDQVNDDRNHKIAVNEEGIRSLIIHAVQKSDAGTYTCIARNAAGEDRFTVSLNVCGTYQYFFSILFIFEYSFYDFNMSRNSHRSCKVMVIAIQLT